MIAVKVFLSGQNRTIGEVMGGEQIHLLTDVAGTINPEPLTLPTAWVSESRVPPLIYEVLSLVLTEVTIVAGLAGISPLSHGLSEPLPFPYGFVRGLLRD